MISQVVEKFTECKLWTFLVEKQQLTNSNEQRFASSTRVACDFEAGREQVNTLVRKGVIF